MTDPQTALFMMCIFLFFVLLGFPIAFTLLAKSVNAIGNPRSTKNKNMHIINSAVCGSVIPNIL